MLELIFSLVILFILLTINYFIFKDFRYPPFLYSLLWFVLILLFLIVKASNLIEINSLSIMVLIIFDLSVFIFSLGGLSIYLIKGKPKIFKTQLIVIRINKNLDNLFFYLTILGFPLFLWKAVQIALSSGMDNFFMGLRWQLNYGDASYGILAYLGMLSIFNASYRALYINEYKLSNVYIYKTYISILVAFMYAVLSTGRTSFLLLLIFLLGISIANKTLTIKKFFISVVSFLLVFFAFAVLLSKGGNMDSSFAENMLTVSEIFVKYLLGGLPALDMFIHSQYEYSLGDNTLRLFYAILNKISLIDTEAVSSKLDFVNIPFSTNVYTVYQFYIKDFGILSLFIFIYIFGFMHTFFYLKMGQSIVMKFLYILMIYPLMMSFYADQYISILSQWIQLFIYIVIVSNFIYNTKTREEHVKS